MFIRQVRTLPGGFDLGVQDGIIRAASEILELLNARAAGRSEAIEFHQNRARSASCKTYLPIWRTIAAMELPRHRRGVLLFFPSREGATPRPTNESCPECKRLERVCEAAFEAIQQALRGPASISEKITEMYRKQDERDRVMAELYKHNTAAHSRRTA